MIALQNINVERKKIRFTATYDRSLVIKADRKMFISILYNLFSNAIKFVPVGGEVRFESEIKDGVYSFCFLNNTEGITSEDLPKLFDKNVVHTTEGTAHEKGTGLGLMICKEFVEIHGGNIRAELTPGNRISFTFTIPINRQV